MGLGRLFPLLPVPQEASRGVAVSPYTKVTGCLSVCVCLCICVSVPKDLANR